MASRITELPAAPDTKNALLLPIVQDGVNYKCTRAALFSSSEGEIVALEFNGASLVFGAGGTWSVASAAGEAIGFAQAAGSSILFTGDGGYILSTPLVQMTVSAAGVVAMTGATAMSWPYFPGASGNWAGDPATMGDALDRIAAAVAGLLAAPIP
jgi:hypothetical protein